MTTHVEIGGILHRLTHWNPLTHNELPRSAVRLGCGRLVTPNCNYADKPVVTLYEFYDRDGDRALVAVE